MTHGLSTNNLVRHMRGVVMSGSSRLLSSALLRIPKVHASRLAAVSWAVGALVRGARLTVTGLGRTGLEVAPKHAIKRADRLVGNEKLLADHDVFFQALAQTMLPRSGRIVLLVDWTKLDDEHYALFAAAQHSGRALPLRFEVHPIERHGRPDVEEHFLKRLRELLPDREVVLVTDAGYRTDWFKACEALGFHYVGRLTGYAKVSNNGGTWISGRALATPFKARPVDLGSTLVTKTRRHPARVVIAPTPPIKRRRKGTRPLGDRATQKARRAAMQPWVLVTSLSGQPSEVVGLYAKRMQIEESFRDFKSPRFGRSLRYSRSSGVLRLSNLLLLDMLASLVLALIGRVAERRKLHRRFQANTARTRVLSHGYLARAIMSCPLRRHFGPSVLRREAWRLRSETICGDS